MMQFISDIWGAQFVIGFGCGMIATGLAMVIGGLADWLW